MMERLDRELAGKKMSEKDEEKIRELERGGPTEMGEGRLDPEEEGGVEVGVAEGVNEDNQKRRETSHNH
jgi:hypothetical protein